MRILVWFLILFLLSGIQAFASSKAGDVNIGNTFYEKGDYPKALEKYQDAIKKDPESDIINFDLGTASYKNEKYQDAISYLQKSLLSEESELKNKAHYNLGNAYYKFGISHENDNLDLAIKSLEGSLSQYEGAIKLDPKDKDAQYNYEIVKKELEQLKEKQKKQQQQQSQCSRPQKNDQGQQEQQQNQQDQKQQQDKQQEQQQQQQQQQQQEQQQSQQQENQGKKEQEQSSQQQQSQQEKQQPQDQQAASQNESGQEQNEEQQSASTPSGEQQQKMTKEEAQRLLDRYQQTEEPKGLLNLNPQKAIEAPVLKDW